MPSAASVASTAVTVASNIAGVADHVGIGEVHHDDVEFSAFDFLARRASAISVRAHRGFKVVGRDLRRRNQHALFDRRTAFRLRRSGSKSRAHTSRSRRCADCGISRARQHLGERVASHPRGRTRAAARMSGRIRSCRRSRPSERAVANESAEDSSASAAVKLARAIGAEVEADDLIAVVDSARLADRCRLDELVALVRRRRISRPPRARMRRRRAFAFDDVAPRALDAVPSLVAIHRDSSVRCTVAIRPRPSSASASLRARSINGSAERGGLSRPSSTACTAISPSAVLRGEIEQRDQMIDMAVHAAVGEQPPEVQRVARRSCRDRVEHRRVAREIAPLSIALVIRIRSW